jgi:hypothetical protein
VVGSAILAQGVESRLMMEATICWGYIWLSGKPG